MRRTLRRTPGPRFWLGGLALAASVIVVVGAVWVLIRPGEPAAPASVLAAAEVYRGARQELVPLAIHSSDVAAVNAWLARTLSFPVNEPVQQTSAMTLEGASVLDLAGEQVGYVQYRRDAHQVSLFLLPPRAWPEAGRHVQVRAVEFHLFTIDGLNLVAWNHPPLSYVLASDLGGRGGEACAVCHSGMTDAAWIGFASGDEI